MRTGAENYLLDQEFPFEAPEYSTEPDAKSEVFEEAPRPFKDVLAEAQSEDEVVSMPAFEELWKRTSNSVRHAAWQFGANEKVEDNMQEAAIKVIQNLKKWQAPVTEESIEPSFRKWLRVITTNVALDDKRKASCRIETVSFDEPLPGTDSPDTSTHEHSDTYATIQTPDTAIEVDETIVEAMKKIPDGFRKIVFAVDVMGNTPNEYAEDTGMKRSTVGTKLHRGRIALGKAIVDGEISLEIPRHYLNKPVKTRF